MFASFTMHFTNAIVSALILSSSLVPQAWSYETNQQRRSDAGSVLNDIKDRYQLPALGVALSPDFSSQVIGVRKAGTDVTATNNDIWALGSDTKAMVATVLARLVTQNRLAWNNTLREIFPDMNMLPAYENTTIELMSAHRSGITDDAIANSTFLVSLYSQSAAVGRRMVAEAVFAAAPSSKPGQYVYANSNYIILGLIIEVVTQQPAEQVVTDLLFQPLGMSSANFGAVPETSTTSIDNPWPHQPSPQDGSPIPVGEGLPVAERDLPPAYNTAGTAHMTLFDWSKFLDVHLMAAVRGQDSNVLNLSAPALAKLHTPFPDTNTSSEGYGYTYGAWLRSNYTSPGDGSVYTLLHCGSNTVNDACAVVDGKRQKNSFVVTNIGGKAADAAMRDVLDGLGNGTILLTNTTASAATRPQVPWKRWISLLSNY